MANAPITPMPKSDLGSPVMLVGGTFDPPHLAHTELARQARDAAAPGAMLLFVPAARSPHKPGGPEASGEDRVRMLRLAIAGLDRADVWTDELDRAAAGEPSYWVVTLERARELIGSERELFFLIGADQAIGFERWKSPEAILRLARAIVINRGEIRTREQLALALDGSRFRDRLVDAWCEVEHLDISATAVREALGANRSHEIERMLHPDVLREIRVRALYRD